MPKRGVEAVLCEPQRKPAKISLHGSEWHAGETPHHGLMPDKATSTGSVCCCVLTQHFKIFSFTILTKLDMVGI